MIWLLLSGLLSLIASSAVAYLWWVKVREMRLRQDIFAIRDDLFDAAVREGWLDDPAYQAFRMYLNSALAFAHHLSVPVLIYLAKVPIETEPFPRSANGRLQKAIEVATERVACRVVRFVRYETLLGLLVEVATRIATWAKPAEEKEISERIAPGHLPSAIIRPVFG